MKLGCREHQFMRCQLMAKMIIDRQLVAVVSGCVAARLPILAFGLVQGEDIPRREAKPAANLTPLEPQAINGVPRK